MNTIILFSLIIQKFKAGLKVEGHVPTVIWARLRDEI